MVGDIREAAKLLAHAQAPAIIIGNDLLAQDQGKENAVAVADLFLMIGQPGNAGSGLYPIAEKNNTHGVCDMGVLPDLLPGYQALNADSSFAAAWKKQLSTVTGYTLDEALNRLENNAVNAPQAFYIMGGDLVRQVPNSKRVLSILQKAKFIVMQGAFMTEVAKVADVVLPVNIHAEVSGTYTNTDGKLGQLKAAVSGNGCKPGWQIISDLSRKLDSPLDYVNAEDIFKEMSSHMPLYAGMQNGYRWPCPSITAEIQGKFLPFGTEVSISGEGPFILIVGKTMGHSGSYTTWADGPMTVMNSQAMRINSADAAKLVVGEGDLVKISSAQGAIEVKVTLCDDLPAGVVFLADHFADPMANTLTFNSNLCRVTIQKG